MTFSLFLGGVVPGAWAQEADFFERDGWQGGTAFVRALEGTHREVQFALSADQLRIGDVVLIVSPSESTFSEVELSDLVTRVSRVVIFDEKRSSQVYVAGTEDASGRDPAASHINGVSQLPVVEANVHVNHLNWSGQIAFNHPAPVRGIGAPLVGDKENAYVFAPVPNMIVVRDASLLTNFMYPMFDNSSFISALTSCGENGRYVVYPPSWTIGRGAPQSLEERISDAYEYIKFRLHDPKDVLSHFPWKTLFQGVIVFWLILAASMAFSWSKD